MAVASGRTLPLALITSFCLWIAPQAVLADASEVQSTFGDDLFMAGSDVRIAEGSRGDAILAGGWISTGGAVHGDEVATGGQLNLSADVDGGVYAAGGRVNLDGRVARNARIAGGHVDLGRKAEVQGGLTIGGGEVPGRKISADRRRQDTPRCARSGQRRCSERRAQRRTGCGH